MSVNYFSPQFFFDKKDGLGNLSWMLPYTDLTNVNIYTQWGEQVFDTLLTLYEMYTHFHLIA